MGKEGLQNFGGDWTEEKLTVIQKYLAAYVTALSKQEWAHKIYLDAFAGTGYRELSETPDDAGTLYQDLADDEVVRFREGSAARALQVEPPFDEYIFVEADRERADELQRLKAAHPRLNIRVEVEDCNTFIPRWCRSLSWDHRAVVFLDPYGMQVNWSSLQALGTCRKADVWLLFPLWQAVSRVLMLDLNKMPPKWKDRLDIVFGTTDWIEELYLQEEPDLFQQAAVRRRDVADIGMYFLKRLRRIFAGVAKNPRVLRKADGHPLFQLHFCVGNPSKQAQKIALDIANHILNNL